MPDFSPVKSTLLWQLTFEGAWPLAVTFLGNRRLAAANEKGEIYVWVLPDAPDPATVEALKQKKEGGERPRTAPSLAPVRRLDGHTNAVTRLAATPDGRTLVSTSLDRTVRLWDVDSAATGKADAVLDIDSRKAEAKRTRKDDALGAPGVSIETQTATRVLEGHTDWVHSLGISGDGRRIISGDAAANIIVREVATGSEVARWKGRSWNWMIAAALSPDGETAFVSEHRYRRDDFDVPVAALRLWNVAEKKETLDLLRVQFPKYNPDDSSYGGSQVWRKFVGAGLVSVAFSPDGKLVAAAQGGETDRGDVHLLETSTGKLVRDVTGHQSGATDVLFSADGKYVISAGRDTCVRISKVEDGKEALVLGAPRGGQFKDWLSAVTISPDQALIGAADIAGLVQIWRVGS